MAHATTPTRSRTHGLGPRPRARYRSPTPPPPRSTSPHGPPAPPGRPAPAGRQHVRPRHRLAAPTRHRLREVRRRALRAAAARRRHRRSSRLDPQPGCRRLGLRGDPARGGGEPAGRPRVRGGPPVRDPPAAAGAGQPHQRLLLSQRPRRDGRRCRRRPVPGVPPTGTRGHRRGGRDGLRPGLHRRPLPLGRDRRPGAGRGRSRPRVAGPARPADRADRLAAPPARRPFGVHRAARAGPAGDHRHPGRRPHLVGAPGMSGFLNQILTVPGWAVLTVVGLLVFAEDALFVGFVLPGETAAVLGGVAAKLGHAPLWAVLVTVIAAAIIGDSVGYEIGRTFGPRVLRMPVLENRRSRLEDARGFLARRGGSAVFLGRWVAFFRAVMPALAGTARMRYPKFLAFNAAGGFVWGMVVVL